MEEKPSPIIESRLSEEDVQYLQDTMGSWHADFVRGMREIKGIDSGIVIMITSSENSTGKIVSSLVKTTREVAERYRDGTIDSDHPEKMETVAMYPVASLSQTEVSRVLESAQREFQGIKGIDTSGYTVIDTTDLNGFKLTYVNLREGASYSAVVQ